jgi:hypothetical protein
MKREKYLQIIKDEFRVHSICAILGPKQVRLPWPEFKYTDQPKLTSSMKIAMHDLKLNHLYVISPGKHVFPLESNITAQGLEAITDLKLS